MMQYIKDIINCNIKHFNFRQSALLMVIIYVFALMASTAHAKDYKLSKSEFLTQVSNGTLALEKAPALAMNPELVQRMIDAMKKEWPGFKDEMFYIAYTKSTNYTYFLFYEWYDRGCVFGVTEPKKYQGNSDKKNGEMALEENKNYEKVDNKYCEKVLGITIPPGGLSKIPNAIKPVKPKGK